MLDKKMFGEVPQKIHNVVINTLESLEERPENIKRSNKRHWRFEHVAVIFCTLFLVTGITVFSVGALRQNYKERMEGMTHEDYERFYSMWEEEMNREFTDDELTRYYELEELYVKNGVFPQGSMKVLEEGEQYEGKGIALDIVNHILYLPESLSDEELLQLIDYQKKHIYSVYMLNEERLNAEIDWRKRMSDMTSEEMEEIYIMWGYARSEVRGAFCRALEPEESIRYDELYKKYETEGGYPEKEIAIIRYRKEYEEGTVAFCVQDCKFYFPLREMSDEEMLQIIDFYHKFMYACGKINDEIDLGVREDYPKIVREYEQFRLRMESVAAKDYEVYAEMDEKGMNRELTWEESERYRQLEDSYKRHGIFPQGQLKVLSKGETYGNTGVAFEAVTGMLLLPAQLSDEDLLQIIDFRSKCAYSEYMIQTRIKRLEYEWINCAEELSYEEMTDIYLLWRYAAVDERGEFSEEKVVGGFSRELTPKEEERYKELVLRYETEGLFPKGEISTVSQENLIKDEPVFYIKEGLFYLPTEELTDEELLQIIEFTHRAQYVCNKMDYEVSMGLREEYYICK